MWFNRGVKESNKNPKVVTFEKKVYYLLTLHITSTSLKRVNLWRGKKPVFRVYKDTIYYFC